MRYDRISMYLGELKAEFKGETAMLGEDLDKLMKEIKEIVASYIMVLPPFEALDYCGIFLRPSHED